MQFTDFFFQDFGISQSLEPLQKQPSWDYRMRYLKISRNLSEKLLWCESLFHKVSGKQPITLLKKCHLGCFNWNFCWLSEKPFSRQTTRGCVYLLKMYCKEPLLQFSSWGQIITQMILCVTFNLLFKYTYIHIYIYIYIYMCVCIYIYIYIICFC